MTRSYRHHFNKAEQHIVYYYTDAANDLFDAYKSKLAIAWQVFHTFERATASGELWIKEGRNLRTEPGKDET